MKNLKTLRAMLVRLGGLFRRKQHEAEMNEELRAHVDALIERNVAEGMAPDEARCAALRAFGGVAQIAERARDERRSVWGEQVLQDLRYAVRQWGKSPGFSAVVVLTLALGIGGNAAIFTFVDAVLLKPLPYAEPGRIVRVLERRPDGGTNGIAALNYLDWVRENTVFESLAAWTNSRVTPSYFQIFDVKAALGRTFAPAEGIYGQHRVVVLGHGRWQAEFGGNPQILGRSILIDGEPHTIVGVLPVGRSLVRGSDEQLWRPLAFAPEDLSRTGSFFGAFARLKPGVTLEQARARMTVIGARIAREHPDARKGWGVAVDAYAGTIVGGKLRRSLQMLLGAVGLVLLIACANLANLGVARGLARERELAIRASLGAGRGRLFRQLLTESALLSAAGGALGIALGYGMMRALDLALPPHFLPREAAVGMDGRVLLFTVLLTGLAALMCGVWPALHAVRRNLAQAVVQGSTGTGTDRARRKIRAGLMVVEVALAFVLLTGAGLLVRSFLQLHQVALGFDPTNVVTAEIPISSRQIETGEALNAYLGRIGDAVAAVPGVRAVAFSSAPPFRFSYGYGFRRADRETNDPAARHGAFVKIVSASYFPTLGIRIVKGRGLAARDVRSAPRVAVINEALAQEHFSGENPIGKRLLVPELVYGTKQIGPEVAWEVVGVIANERVDSLDARQTTPGLYVTNYQCPTTYQTLLVRGAIDPGPLHLAIRQAVRAVDRNLTLPNLKTIDQIKSDSLADNRLRSALLGLFALTALLLAAIGIYGVVSYGVAQRTREIGIRVALGAAPGRVLALVIRGGMSAVAMGLVLGGAAGLGLTHLLASLLFGVAERDPGTFAGAGALLAGTALVACWLPARRAAKIDPMVALRAE